MRAPGLPMSPWAIFLLVSALWYNGVGERPDRVLLRRANVCLINVGLAPASTVAMRYQVLDQDNGTEGTGETLFSNVENGRVYEKDLSISYDLGDTSLKLSITLEYENQDIQH